MQRGQAAFAAFRKCDYSISHQRSLIQLETSSNILLPVIATSLRDVQTNSLILSQPPNVHNMKISNTYKSLKSPKNNIDYFYKFNEILREDFTKVIHDPKIFFSTKMTQYLHEDLVATIDFKNSYYRKLLSTGHGKRVVDGKKAFINVVNYAVTSASILYSSPKIESLWFSPKPELLVLEQRWMFSGVTRYPKNKVRYDFVTKFYFDGLSKQVVLIEITDSEKKHDKVTETLLEKLIRKGKLNPVF